MDSFSAKVHPSLEHAEAVFLFRTLMADLSVDHPEGMPNLGPIVGGQPSTLQQIGDPLIKNVHGFHVVTNK